MSDSEERAVVELGCKRLALLQRVCEQTAEELKVPGLDLHRARGELQNIARQTSAIAERVEDAWMDAVLA